MCTFGFGLSWRQGAWHVMMSLPRLPQISKHRVSNNESPNITRWNPTTATTSAGTSTREKGVFFLSADKQTNVSSPTLTVTQDGDGNWGETLRLRVSLCLCLSHSCEHPCTYACIVRVNQPLKKAMHCGRLKRLLLTIISTRGYF